MRVITIGDIHGCIRSLQILERIIPLRQGELLVTLGDYVDRGPDSRGVLDWLIGYQETGGQLVPLLGNHELMMLRARTGILARNRWLANGGMETLRSYQPADETGESPPERSGSLEDVPAKHWEFLEACRPFYETESHLFVHATLDPELPLAEQPEETLYWERFADPPPHQSGKHMVCGHTPQRDGHPRALPHATCIDTLVYQGGWLTALEIETGRCWQANEEGEARSGLLEMDG